MSQEGSLTMSGKRRLKVLDGIHAGAELSLADGTYVIGSDFSCDMILLDKDVRKQHLQLRVAGQHIDIECIDDAELELDGVKTASSDVRIADGVTMTLGPVNLTIYQPYIEPEPELPPAASMSSQNNVQPPQIEVPVGADAAAGKRSKKRAGRYLLISLPVIALAAAGAFFASGFASELTPRFASGFVSRLAPDPIASPQPKNRISSSEGERPAAASAAPSPQAFLDRAHEFLSDDSLDMKLDKAGRIVVSGTTSSEQVRKDIHRLQKEFSGAIEIVDKVTYVFNKTQNSQGDLISLPQAITNISIGQPSWFQTADGTRNFVGSRLADGAEVVKIGLHEVLFKRDGKLIVFQFDSKEFANDGRK
ncbi:MAG TPA: FHA domain-containing protein [Noviherbaspirillum sp.]|nr:FHA domain-containing protein [Noviherbaspirillum sp.]